MRPHNTYICHNDHDPRHEYCSDFVDNPEDRFAHDAAHINQRFFTISQRFFTLAKALQLFT